MDFRIGKAPYKSHHSNVGYRGLLHHIFSKKLVIPRNAFGTRQERLTPINHKIGRPRKIKSGGLFVEKPYKELEKDMEALNEQD